MLINCENKPMAFDSDKINQNHDGRIIYKTGLILYELVWSKRRATAPSGSAGRGVHRLVAGQPP